MDEFENRYQNIEIIKPYIKKEIKLNTSEIELKQNDLALHLKELRKYIVENIINEINNEIYQTINIDRIILNTFKINENNLLYKLWKNRSIRT